MATTLDDRTLTEVELKLVECVEQGTLLDLAPGRPVDEKAMRSWEASQTVRAWVIRDIVRGEQATKPDPHGLRLRGARIDGRLDLMSVTSKVRLDLESCLLEEGLDISYADLTFVQLIQCHVEHDSKSAVDGRQLTVDKLSLKGTSVTGHSSISAVRLYGAKIGSALTCDGAVLRNEAGPALSIEQATIDGPVLCRSKFIAVGAGVMGAIRLMSAQVNGSLECDGASIRNESGPALQAERARFGGPLFLRNGFTAVGSGNGGTIRLMGAQIAGSLDLKSANIRNELGPAVQAERVRFDGSVALDKRSDFVGAGERGAISLYGAQIGGSLEFDGASVRNSSGPAVNGSFVQVGGAIGFRDGFSGIGVDPIGAIRLMDAQVTGTLECSGASIRNESGPALHVERTRIDGPVFLRDGFTAVGAGGRGTIRLFNTQVGGALDASGADIRNESGPAVNAELARFGGPVSLGGSFTAVGAGGVGAVCLVNAEIKGSLIFGGADIRNESGPAVLADFSQIEGTVSLVGDCTMEGRSVRGALSLRGVQVREVLECDGATLRNQSGPALNAEGARFGGSVLLRANFAADGAGAGGAIRFLHAQIGGALEMWDAHLRNESGPAMLAIQLHVDGSAHFSRGFTAVSDGSGATLDMREMEIKGKFEFKPAKLTHLTYVNSKVNVDGLTYAGIPMGFTTREWLKLLRSGVPDYAAQPYQQLAAVHRAAGHDKDARKVLMAQRRDQVQLGAITSYGERVWVNATGLFLGYGYQPWRALLFLLGVILYAVLAATTLGGDGGLARVQKSATSPGCSRIEQIGVGLDLGRPLLTTGVRARCDTTDTPAGEAMMVIGWGLQMLAWVFATLFIAGFTGAVRKT